MKFEIVNRILKNRMSKYILFVFLLLATSYYYNYQEIIKYRPISTHQWRNSVSASMALNYYHEGEFFHPRTHNMQVDDHSSDITITEFPILYYFIGMLYRVFGYHEIIYKLINVLIGFSGLFFLFKLGLRTFQNTFYAIIPPLLIFSSPIYVYYLNNYMPDATSLSLVLIGLYFFYRYYEEGRGITMLYTMIFLGLAGLIKTPAFLLFFAIIGIYGLDRILNVRFKSNQNVFTSWIQPILFFGTVMLLTFAWYAYAKIYTDRHGGVVSLVEIRPIWRLSNETINATLHAVSVRFRAGHYHSRFLILFSLLLFLNNLIFWKKYNRLFSWLSVLSIIGAVCFSMLFFRSMRQHDYYQMNNLIVFILIMINFILFLKDNLPTIYKSWITKSVFAVFLLFLVYTCNNFIEKKYYSGWFMDHALENYNNRYGEITPYLRSLGIDRYDKVYCTYDPSINISLYLMDQKGFTDFYRRDMTFSKKVEYFRQNGLKYVILGDYDSIDKDPEDLDLVKIGEYNGVGIYKVN